MNKLREKLDNFYIYAYDSIDGSYEQKLKSKEVDELEQITDDFSVKFAEWYLDNYHMNNTTNELLKIFKEKYYS